VQTAGYSGRSLAEKLGVKAGVRLCGVNAPDHYETLIGPLPPSAAYSTDAGDADIIHVFVADRADLARLRDDLVERPKAGAALWFSWPKKSSALFVDLTEGGIRELILPTGWVDVKVCAVDDDWSGLKFLRRRSNPAK
jgi:hypothetical protein